MSGDEGHFGPPALDTLHKKHLANDDTEGGACLTGHEYKYERRGNKKTCNYRYQAWEQADAHGGIKAALHSYETKTITTPIRTSSWKKLKPEYCAILPKPRPGDWHLDGPRTDITRKSFAGATKIVDATMNFTKELWPYWNNAHHLIPKGTFQAKVVAEGEPVSSLIQKALLTAQYNINHKINMLLMPQDKRVAAILGLPRHIQLRDKDAPGLAPICGNHPVYNEMTCTIRNGLNSIIRNYRKICNEAIDAVKGTHKVPKPSLDKKKLENLSKRLLKMILGATAAGKIKKGQAIDVLGL